METNPRDFLKATAVSALSYDSVRGANGRIQIGAIGTGRRCRYLLGILAELGQTDLLAVCDVYGPHRRETKEKYAPSAKEYVDYRELLTDSHVDAVVIGSPDHWHVQMTIDAVGAGKDVYVEKPVTHSLEEGIRLQEAVDRCRQVVQTGTQQRSWSHFIQARDLVQNGELGKVTLVKSFWYQSYLKRSDVANRKVSLDQLDWRSWLGSAPEQPFDNGRFFNWRWFWDFGGGAFTDLFTHWVDVAHWFMGQDAPEIVQAMGDIHLLDHLECPDTVSGSLRYPGRFTVQYTGSMIGCLEGAGMVFRGPKGMLKLNRRKL